MTGTVLEKLKGGDRRSIGRVDEVLAEVLADPGVFEGLFQGLLAEDPVLRMRAADAVEKVSREHPEYLEPFKALILEQVADIEQKEVQWHVALMMPRLVLTDEEAAAAVEILTRYLGSGSRIVQVNAMQALVDMGDDDSEQGMLVALELIEQLVQSGSPAVQARGRKILAELNARTLSRMT